MKVKLLLLVAITLISLLTPVTVYKTFAQSTDELNKQAQDKESEIDRLKAKISELQQQDKTLKSQLDIIDSQTKITELKIQQTNIQIEKLKREISDLSGRITRIASNVDSLSEVLLSRIIQTYKYSSTTPLDLIFSSRGFADAIERLKYIQIAQTNDKKVLYQLQATKAAYNDQKQDKETRQAEAERLKKDLDVYSSQLAEQKKSKAALLRATQNDEATFRAKLQSALAEQIAILSILKGAGNEIKDGRVGKGNTIGHYIIGKSACSSGSHLHFEVHRNNQIENPSTDLVNKSVIFDNSPDGTFSFTGSWDWPIKDQIYIAQGFGITYWAKLGWYSIPPGHTGIDMYSTSENSVVAVHDGELSHGGIACGGGTLLYKRVDHGDGMSSYYLHVI